MGNTNERVLEAASFADSAYNLAIVERRIEHENGHTSVRHVLRVSVTSLGVTITNEFPMESPHAVAWLAGALARTHAAMQAHDLSAHELIYGTPWVVVKSGEPTGAPPPDLGEIPF